MQPDAQVFVVDDDEGVRSSLHALLETSGFPVRAHESAEDFLRCCVPTAIGCVIVDLRLPGLDGLELQQRMIASNILLPIIFMTAHGDVPSAVEAMKAGAVDCIEKPFDDTVMIATVQHALRLGEQTRGPTANPKIRSRIDCLSPRELEVYRYLLAGLANKEIAREINISPRTIEIHRGNLMRKLGTRNNLQLARMALEVGIEPIKTKQNSLVS